MEPIVRVAVLADTHLKAGQFERLPPQLFPLLEAADVIVHAGDVTEAVILERLAAWAPVHAVAGNNDAALEGSLPETIEVDLAGMATAVVHDSGPRAGRPVRLRRRFPEARLVIFGHSHIPFDQEGVDGQHLFNPGSPTQRRRQPVATAGWLEIRNGDLHCSRIVPLGSSGVVRTPV